MKPFSNLKEWQHWVGYSILTIAILFFYFIVVSILGINDLGKVLWFSPLLIPIIALVDSVNHIIKLQ